MGEQIVRREDRAGVATLTLDNPAKLNALSGAMMRALQDQFDTLAADRETRVVILRGAGKAFCAGHDLREMTDGRQSEDGGARYFEALFAQCSELMLTIPKLPQPVIAEVHGIATAAGCQLVASCDLAVAAEGTRFGVNGVNIGLFCSTPMVALSRNVGLKHAFRMLTTGDFVDAAEARAMGLVNEVVPETDLGAATRNLAERIAGKLGAVVAIGKRAFYEQAELPRAEAYAHTAQVMAQNMMRTDTAEGISAFLEKRAPDWAR